MKLIAVTLSGIEDIAINEILEKLGKKAKRIADGRVLFDSDQEINLRSIDTLYQLIKHFTFKKEKDLISKLRKIKFKIEEPFMVRCFRTGEHSFSSLDIERKLGGIIFEFGYEVSLKQPKTVVYTEIINRKCIVGILLKDKLGKREYRLRRHPASISAILAYSMLKIANFRKNSILLDPFCRDGIIPIEAALIGGRHVHGFDESLNNIRNAKINAGLAKAYANFSKYEIGWLDTKFKKASIDCIVTSPPYPSKRRKMEGIEALYREFFYQAKYVLKKNGCIVMAIPKPELIEKCAKDFKLKEKRKVMVGKLLFYVLKFA